MVVVVVIFGMGGEGFVSLCSRSLTAQYDHTHCLVANASVTFCRMTVEETYAAVGWVKGS